MPFGEALFWFGITIFGTGLYFTFEKGSVSLSYAIPFMIVGLVACIYPVVRHHYPNKQLPAISGWQILLILTWIFFGYDVYISHKQPKIMQQSVTKEVAIPYRYAYRPDHPLTAVTKQFFQNQKVPLDGMSYKYCVFRNVTFEFDGTAPFQMDNVIVLGNHGYDTGNPAVWVTVAMVAQLGVPNVKNLRDNGRIPEIYDNKHIDKLTPQNTPDWVKELNIPNYAMH